MATPSMAVLQEALDKKETFASKETGKMKTDIVKVRSSKAFDAQSGGDVVKSLSLIINMLGKIMLGNKANEIKKHLLTILITCLEKCKSIPLLCSVTTLFGDLTTRDKSPLTQKEKTNFHEL